ncbi:MAG: tetratricopeptide repeat protein [Roseburia sp.]|nr:tetratricopeptide repeat protein [Roseburia sp.]
MDKYEYKLKLDQMKSFTAENNYSAAAEIADTINWHKIKNVNALMKAGEIYEKTGRYEESRDILLMAYDRSPIGRMIIYRLAEVAVKMGNYSEAQDYYQEFVEIAPHDNLKYVLKYEISKAQGADLNTLIAILEELKEQEYSEEWAFELACLYHKAGMSDKCIDACDELILWFGDGPYVERALELKMLYQPLTKQQEEKYRQFRLKKEGVIEVRPDEELESGEIVSEPVQIPKVGLSPERFNTQNLQEELQRSMQQIMEATEKETVDDSMDTIKKLVEDIPYLQIPKEEPLPEETAELPHIETDAEIDDSLKNNFKELLAEDYDGQMSLFVPDKGTAEPQITGQMSIDEVLAEWERTKRAAETALQEAEQRKLQSAKARALQEAGDIMERLVDVIPKLDSGLTPKDLLEEQYLGGQPIADDAAAEMVANMNQILQQEIDRLSTENARMDEQLAAAEAAKTSGMDMAAYGASFAAGDAARLTEPEVEALLGAGVQELLPGETDEALGADAASLTGEPEELEASLGADVASLMGEPELEASLGADVASLMHEQQEIAGQETGTFQRAGEAPTSVADVVSLTGEPEELEASLTGEPEESEEIESALGATIAALMEDDPAEKAAAQRTKKLPTEKLPEIEEPEEEGPHVITRLSKEQREIFTYFVPIKGMEQQLCQAMTGAAQRLSSGGRASTGNMIIQGGQGSGKTVLATSMIKALQKEVGKPNGRIGKIEASVLNQKDAAALLKKVAGGCLIIEKAGGISKEMAVKLGMLLESDTSGLLVIIEDTRRGIEKALGRDAGFAARFSEKITIPIFTSDELVSFAKAYARELGYTIDEMGVLALYNSISNIQKLDQATTLTEVKDIVDGAIAHAERGGLKKAFSIIASRRYDEDDYVILHEKDFGF